MSKDGYYGDFGSFSEEQRQYEIMMEDNQQDYPDVVPCFKCGGQMYLASNVPEENVCEECKQTALPTSEGKKE